jgi:hypothetical protein
MLATFEARGLQRLPVDGMARLLRDHVEGEPRQHEVAAGVLFSRGLRDAPNIIDNVIVPHCGDLLLPLGGQQTQPHDAAERPDILGRGSLPDRSDLVVIENAIARFGIAAFHASGENRDVVRPAGVPICHAPQISETGVGLPRAMLVLNPIEQFRNIGPFQLDEGTFAQNWQDIFAEAALDLGSRPQPFGGPTDGRGRRGRA